MTTLAINAKYADILAPLGDVQQVVDEAVRRYAVEKLGERIAEVRRALRPFEERYGCPYEVFSARVTTDEDFAAGLREGNPTWECDSKRPGA